MQKLKLIKSQYKIREVASILDIPATTLRYWELEFPQLNPHRTQYGQRRYSKDDVMLIAYIRDLMHVRQISLEKAKEMIGTSFRKQDSRHVFVCNSENKAVKLLNEAVDLISDNSHAVARIEAVLRWLENKEGAPN